MQSIIKYQEIDGKLLKIENELKGCEERKKAKVRKEFLLKVDSVAERLDKKAQDLTARFNELTAAIGQKEAELKEYSGVADGLEAHTEVDYIVKKLEKISSEIKGLQMEIAELNKEVDDNVREFAELKAKNKQAREEYTMYRERYELKKQAKQPEIDRLKQQLADMEKSTDKKYLKMYREKRDQKLFPVFVKAHDGEMCGGCLMNIPLVKQNELKANKMIECEECKRYIYLE